MEKMNEPDAKECAARFLEAGIYYDVKQFAKEEKAGKQVHSGVPFHEDNIYGFQAHDVSETMPLNMWRKFCVPEGCLVESNRDPFLVLKKAKGQLTSIVSKHTDSDGMVDYIAVANDPDYDSFRTAVSEFQE